MRPGSPPRPRNPARARSARACVSPFEMNAVSPLESICTSPRSLFALMKTKRSKAGALEMAFASTSGQASSPSLRSSRKGSGRSSSKDARWCFSIKSKYLTAWAFSASGQPPVGVVVRDDVAALPF